MTFFLETEIAETTHHEEKNLNTKKSALIYPELSKKYLYHISTILEIIRKTIDTKKGKIS